MYAACRDMAMPPSELLALPAPEREFLLSGAVEYAKWMGGQR